MNQIWIRNWARFFFFFFVSSCLLINQMEINLIIIMTIRFDSLFAFFSTSCGSVCAYFERNLFFLFTCQNPKSYLIWREIEKKEEETKLASHIWIGSKFKTNCFGIFNSRIHEAAISILLMSDTQFRINSCYTNRISLNTHTFCSHRIYLLVCFSRQF